MKTLRFLFLLLFTALLSSTANGQFVRPGSVWGFLDDGSDQGLAWQGLAFDDSTWRRGSAELGYGDGDETTIVSYGLDENNKYVTTYFRHTFQVANPAIVNMLALGLIRDDGVVVYLNGTQIFRNNLPAGAPNYLTFASNELSELEESSWLWKSIDPTLLLTGNNVLAVEIHQASLTGEDISFDLTLDETLLIPPGTIWHYLDDGSDQGIAWSQPSFDATSWSEGPAELGYGDSDEVTEVSFGGNSAAKFPTTYFRTEFQVQDPTYINDLNLGVLRDDGVVVYLNGLEIMRDNMPVGPIDFLTFANSALSGSQETAWNWITLDPALLLPGVNVIAAEIHQADASSPDISFNLELLPKPKPDLARGPYLQNGTENSVVVRWRTRNLEDSLVEFGAAPGALIQNAYDPTLTTEHELEVSGLATASKYFYSIGNSVELRAGDTPEHYFTTFPTTGEAKPSRIWVLGDPGRASGSQRAVRDAYYAWTGATETDLWLLLGDNAYSNGSDTEYQNAFFDIYPDTLQQSVCYTTRGNHERYPTDFYNMFTLPQAAEAGGLASGSEAYYSFDFANVHFVCLDSEGTNRLIGAPMITWLENDLASTTQDWIIAFWHHPPYSKGTHDSDNFSDGEGRMFDMRERFLPILENHGVDLVLCGHSHTYERSFLIDGHYGISTTWDSATMLVDAGDGREDGQGAYAKPAQTGHAGTVYTVAGTSSATGLGSLDHPVMYQSVSVLGSVILDVTAEKLLVTFLDSTGFASDYFTLKKQTSGPWLDLRNLTAGLQAIAIVSGLNPGSLTYLGYSLTGAGPTPTQWGDAALSLPITHWGPIPADQNGEGILLLNIPITVLGMTIYSQALELQGAGAASFSNARADVVQ